VRTPWGDFGHGAVLRTAAWPAHSGGSLELVLYGAPNLSPSGMVTCRAGVHRPVGTAQPIGAAAHAVPGRAHDTLSAVVTTQRPHTLRRFGTAGAVGAEVQARQGLRGKRHGEEDQPLGKEARRRLTRNCDTSVERWGGAVAFDGSGGLSVASNNMTKSCAVGRERERKVRPSTMK
jgi:hypothetical protein